MLLNQSLHKKYWEIQDVYKSVVLSSVYKMYNENESAVKKEEMREILESSTSKQKGKIILRLLNLFKILKMLYLTIEVCFKKWMTKLC